MELLINQLTLNDKLKTILIEIAQYLEKLYSARLVQIILYGSQARGEAQPDSDIDLLIILNNSVNSGQENQQIGEFTANLCLEHHVVISCTFICLTKFQQEANPFFINVRRDGIPIYPTQWHPCLQNSPLVDITMTIGFC